MFQEKPAFAFTLTVFYDERSKDSHSYTKTYTLKSGLLRYDYEYRGFPDDKDEHKELRANGSMVEAIKGKIKAQSLYANYDKEFPVDKHVNLVRSGSRLTIQDGTDTYSISVTGSRSELNSDEIYQKLSVLYAFIANLFQKL